MHRIFLPYGVTVAHLILVQLVWVRILVGQQKMHSYECIFCCLFRFLYTCQRHGALKGAGLPLVTKNMRNEMTALFLLLFRFFIYVPQKSRPCLRKTCLQLSVTPTGYLDIFKRILMCKVQGLRSPRNRSLLDEILRLSERRISLLIIPSVSRIAESK